jgi:CelD/BcsL family acetyltransferase involved in cellulose biosynthesis
MTNAMVVAETLGMTTRISVSAASPEAIARYEMLGRTGICAPPQSPAWVRAWLATVAPDCVVLTIVEGERTVFALAIEVVTKGPMRMARFVGGTHANGNFALGEPDWLTRATPEIFMDLATALATARPDIDLLLLERLIPEHSGIGNPLLVLPHVQSPNVSLAVDLSGGLAKVFSAPGGKRKLKKHRAQARKYGAAGGFRRMEAQTEDEVDRLLNAFFEMKAARFRKAGITNVFADTQIKAFFRELLRDALPFTPKPFVLHALEVGGKPRAVTGSSLSADRLICNFSAIADDEIARFSPGDFLFFENIQDACDKHLAVYDFSVGDEPYKRLWCDLETRHMDVLVPLTLKGKLLAASMRSLTALKARIKNNPMIWGRVKALRRFVGRKVTDKTSSDA